MKDLNELNSIRRDGTGQYGHFIYELRKNTYAVVIASGGELAEEVGWEHVSVHIRYVNKKRKQKVRTPYWDEMCMIKSLFFKDDECAIQYHPAVEDHINMHPHVLHLWFNKSIVIPVPPKVMV